MKGVLSSYLDDLLREVNSRNADILKLKLIDGLQKDLIGEVKEVSRLDLLAARVEGINSRIENTRRHL